MLDGEIKRLYNKLLNITNEIVDNDVWGNDNNSAYEIYTLLKVFKKNVYYDGLTGPFYQKMINDIPNFEYVYNRLLLNDDLYAASDWIQYTLYNYANKSTKVVIVDDITIEKVLKFIQIILSKKYLNLYKNDIIRIINGKISTKALYNLYKLIEIKSDNFKRLNESFYNPFDDDLLDDIFTEEPKYQSQNNDINSKLIRKIKPYNKSKIGNLLYKDDKVFANRNFFKGDIIEICPVRILHDEDLYSSNVRKIVFPIDLSQRIFGVPFGLSSVARSENEAKLRGNVDFEYDPSKSKEIIIKAISNIKRGDEIIFICDNKMQYDKNLSPEHIHPDEIIKITPIIK